MKMVLAKFIDDADEVYVQERPSDVGYGHARPGYYWGQFCCLRKGSDRDDDDCGAHDKDVKDKTRFNLNRKKGAEIKLLKKSMNM